MWLKDGTFRGWNLFGVHFRGSANLICPVLRGSATLVKCTPYIECLEWRKIKQSESSVTFTPKRNSFHHPTVCLSKDCSTLRALVIKPLMNDFRTKTVPTSTHIRHVALALSGKFPKVTNLPKMLVHFGRVSESFLLPALVISTGVLWFMLGAGTGLFWNFVKFTSYCCGLSSQDMIIWVVCSSLDFVSKMLLVTSIKLQHCIGKLERPLVSNNNSCIYLVKLGLPWTTVRHSI